MVGAIGQPAKALREFSLDEVRGPIAGPISDAEIDVMNFKIAHVMADDFGHRAWTRHHDRLVVPQRLVEAVPRRFEKFERLRQVGSKSSCGTDRTDFGCSISVVLFGMQSPSLAHGWTAEDPDMRAGLVREMRHDVSTRISRQQAR